MEVTHGMHSPVAGPATGLFPASHTWDNGDCGRSCKRDADSRKSHTAGGAHREGPCGRTRWPASPAVAGATGAPGGKFRHRRERHQPLPCDAAGSCLSLAVGQPVTWFGYCRLAVSRVSQQVEQAGMRVEVLPPHLQVTHGGEDRGMAHQHLDGAQVKTGFQEMRGEAVAQRVNAETLLVSRPALWPHSRFSGRRWIHGPLGIFNGKQMGSADTVASKSAVPPAAGERML